MHSPIVAFPLFLQTHYISICSTDVEGNIPSWWRSLDVEGNVPSAKNPVVQGPLSLNLVGWNMLHLLPGIRPFYFMPLHFCHFPFPIPFKPKVVCDKNSESDILLVIWWRVSPQYDLCGFLGVKCQESISQPFLQYWQCTVIFSSRDQGKWSVHCKQEAALHKLR